jgi:hypothetical protein
MQRVLQSNKCRRGQIVEVWGGDRVEVGQRQGRVEAGQPIQKGGGEATAALVPVQPTHNAVQLGEAASPCPPSQVFGERAQIGRQRQA